MSITLLANQTIRQDFHLASVVGYHIVHLNSGSNEIVYDGALLDVTKTTIAGLLGIYYYTGAEWLTYILGWSPEENTLKSLEYGKTYLIQTSVGQDWQVPNYTEQPPPPPPPTDLDVLLKSGEASANWWSYIQEERLRIASYAIENYSVSLYGELQATAEGKDNCQGGPYTGINENPACSQHFFLRFCIIGNCDLPKISWGRPISARYWRDAAGEWHCHYYPNSFKLPVYSGTLVSMPIGVQHSVCALRIRIDFPESFDSWIFFQYADVNIQPNVYMNTWANNMNPGDILVVRNVVALSSGIWQEGNEEYSWDITEAGAVPR